MSVVAKLKKTKSDEDFGVMRRYFPARRARLIHIPHKPAAVLTFQSMNEDLQGSISIYRPLPFNLRFTLSNIWCSRSQQSRHVGEH